MIFELAYLQIDPQNSDEFEAAVKEAQPCFESFSGCHGMSLGKVMEAPGRYILRVKWESLDTHMIDFRESENFQQWRSLVGKFFIESPTVEHIESDTYF